MKSLTGSVRSRARRVRPIAWRDASIFKLRSQLRKARSELSELESSVQKHGPWNSWRALPSFYFCHHRALRLRELIKANGGRDEVWGALNPKDGGYRFARSHGIAVPKLLGRYSSPEEIQWSDLPDEFVIKPMDGASAQGVFPLVRHWDGYEDLLGDGGPRLKAEDVVVRFRELSDAGKVTSALMVEELLWAPYPGRRSVALDIKIYCFYGAVGLVMVRDSNRSRADKALRMRYFSPAGKDLGDAMAHREIDETIPAPHHLDALVEASGRLSAAIPVPFVRLDFYEDADRVIFGEVTLTPGGPQRPRPDVDRMLGELWEDAEARLRAEMTSCWTPEIAYGAVEDDVENRLTDFS